mmetsp:Transcript_9952/g.23215  ORF Transcript_9952/g.23215 Transcript_9952/m.23215 type:complete len:93 (+) Transcript_9952:2134-2412(+)
MPGGSALPHSTSAVWPRGQLGTRRSITHTQLSWRGSPHRRGHRCPAASHFCSQGAVHTTPPSAVHAPHGNVSSWPQPGTTPTTGTMHDLHAS